jgi:hypothetical protein
MLKLNETLEALDNANAVEESQNFFKVLDKRIDKWIWKKQLFHRTHAIATHNHKRMKRLEVCSKEDNIPLLMDRACVCVNCELTYKCEVGMLYDAFILDNLDKIEWLGAWSPVQL